MQNQKTWSCILIILFLFLAAKSLFAQEKFWEQTNGPYGGDVTALAINSNGHFFAAAGCTVYRSADNGDNWTETTILYL